MGTGGRRRGRRSTVLCLHGNRKAFSAVSWRGIFKRTIRKGGDMRGGAGSRGRDGGFASRGR